MCILSTLSPLNSIENDYYHIEFRMHIGTQALTSFLNESAILKESIDLMTHRLTF